MQVAIEIDRGSSRAIYKQISDRVVRQIQDGYLPAGARLPTVRELAERLSVTRVTVHNAYNDLRNDGWIDATVGKGTFVAGPKMPDDPGAAVAEELTPDSVMNDMRRLNQMSGVLSMAMAVTDPALAPAAEMLDELHGLKDEANSLFQYGTVLGDAPLRQEISSRLLGDGIEARPEEIIITLGGTECITMAIQVLTEPGDAILVEEPTYLGFLGSARRLGRETIPVPMDFDGPDLDKLEELLARDRPRFFYTVPTFQNPTGVLASAEKRTRLLDLAARYDLMIVEDDVYRELAYDEPPPPPLKAGDENDLVVYFSSFSKSLLPGLRTGYMIPPRRLLEPLAAFHAGCVNSGPEVLQRALAEFIRKEKFDQHLRRVLPVNRERRDAMLAALDAHMPDCVNWTKPAGGVCCWLTMPAETNSSELYRAALQKGIAYTPGEVFLTRPRPTMTSMRVCFASLEPAELDSAIATLASLISERLGSSSPAPDRCCEYTSLV